MWNQYKETFVRIQVVIFAVTAGVFAWAHHWDLAGLFFLTMQVGAVLGATWARRLKDKLQPHDRPLPLYRA